MAETLAFQYGGDDGLSSLQLIQQEGRLSCGKGQVAVEFLASPINPLDFMVIAAKYPVKPQSHVEGPHGQSLAIPGSDAAARVLEVGDGVSGLARGDLVVLKTHCRGTWRSHATLADSDLLRIDDAQMDPKLASILRMGIAPAYFMLREYRSLQPGDWILQNAATGTIAHFVAQLAGRRGLGVISVIRATSPNADSGAGPSAGSSTSTDSASAQSAEEPSIKQKLQAAGAHLVLTADELRTTSELKNKRIVLAIDAVADDALTSDMAKHLAPGATLLTAGFLGVRTDPQVNLRQLLWRGNVSLQPFRLSDCLAKRSAEQQADLFAWFAGLLRRGLLQPPELEEVAWTRGSDLADKAANQQSHAVLDAIHRHASGQRGQHKKILVFRNP